MEWIETETTVSTNAKNEHVNGQFVEYKCSSRHSDFRCIFKKNICIIIWLVCVTEATGSPSQKSPGQQFGSDRAHL